MQSAAKRALAELPLRVQTPQAMMLMAFLCAFPPIEFLLVGSVGLVLLELLRLLLGVAPEHHTLKVLESPCSTERCVKRPQSNPATVAQRKRLSATKDGKDVSLDPDAIKVDAVVSRAVNVITTVQTRYPSVDAELPVSLGPEVELKALGPGLLGGPPAVESVVDVISAVVSASLPGARVLHGGRASPKVDVVIVAETATLAAQLQNRLKRGVRSGDVAPLTGSKLQKSALRYCINVLVSKGFKFRRSAFKADEPVISLLAPEHLGGGHAIHVNISVNNPIPLLNAALVQEASAADSRVLPLVASVQRWADARGLAHPSFGPLSSYAWTHVSIFFLQKYMEPPMQLLGSPQSKGDLAPSNSALLCRFFEFCANFSWGEQCMSIREDGWNPGVILADAFREGVDLGHDIQPSSAGRERIRTEAAIAVQRLQEPSTTVSDLLEHPMHGPKFGSLATSSGPSIVEPPPGLSDMYEDIEPLEPESPLQEPPKPPKVPPWRLRAT